MSKSWIFIGMCAVLTLASCKSKESAYRAAYEKAKAAEMNSAATETPATDTSTAVATAPVVTTPAQTAPVQEENVPVRSENVSLVNGEDLKAYNVVCGSFSLKTNAEGLQQTLKNAGYNARIAFNSSANNGQGMYRVVASSFDDRASAVQSRSTLRSTYPDAWLLLKK